MLGELCILTGALLHFFQLINTCISNGAKVKKIFFEVGVFKQGDVLKQRDIK